jgi:hypothetical protein
MKRFLKLTAIIEAATGLALIAVPGIVVRLLLGAEISARAYPSVASREPRCSRSVSPAGWRAMTGKAALREDWSLRC